MSNTAERIRDPAWVENLVEVIIKTRKCKTAKWATYKHAAKYKIAKKVAKGRVKREHEKCEKC